MHLLFDSIILGFLILDGVLIGLLIFRIRKWKRHHKAVPFSAKIVLLAGVLAWMVIFYGSFIEPKLIIIHTQKIFLTDSSNPTEAVPARQKTTVRIALVSDLHLGIYKKTAFAEKMVGAVNALAPDLIVLAGDFLYGEENEGADPEYLRPLKNLRSKYGSFAVLGNHDYEEDFEDEPNFSYEGNERVSAIVRVLSDAGIELLRNESVQIKIDGRNAFMLGGVDEVWTGRADIAKTFKNYSVESKPGIGPKILIAHNPDIIRDAEKAGVDLVFAGHTHGGQIRLPFFGPVPEIPTELGQKYDRGLFTFGKTQLFITSGVAESGPRARLFVPPEIALLEVEFCLECNNDAEKALAMVKNLPEVKTWLALFSAPGDTSPRIGGKPIVEVVAMQDDVYTIHAYEIVPDSGGKTWHTATLNWYYVNNKTGEIKDFFDFEDDAKEK